MMVFILVGILILAGCAPSRPVAQPFQKPSNQPSTSYAAEMTKRPFPTTPEAKMDEAHKLIKHSKEYVDVAIDPRVSTPAQISAMKTMQLEMNMAGLLMKEAGSDFAKRDELEKAREVYWEILRTFTANAYSSLRRQAETELKYLDDQEKRKAPPSQ